MTKISEKFLENIKINKTNYNYSKTLDFLTQLLI